MLVETICAELLATFVRIHEWTNFRILCNFHPEIDKMWYWVFLGAVSVRSTVNNHRGKLMDNFLKSEAILCQ